MLVYQAPVVTIEGEQDPSFPNGALEYELIRPGQLQYHGRNVVAGRRKDMNTR